MSFKREDLLNLPQKIKDDKVQQFVREFISMNHQKIINKASAGEKSHFIKVDKRIQDKLDLQTIKIEDIVKLISNNYPDCKVKFEKDILSETKMGSRVMF